MTREELARELQAIEAALDDRIEIVRTVVDLQGQTIRVYRRSVRLPLHNERNTP